MYTHTYVYTCVHVCVYIYIYISFVCTASRAQPRAARLPEDGFAVLRPVSIGIS